MKRMPGGSRAIYVALMAELGHGRRRFINRFLSPALCSSLVPQAANSGWRAGGSPAGLASPLASRGGSALQFESAAARPLQALSSGRRQGRPALGRCLEKFKAGSGARGFPVSCSRAWSPGHLDQQRGCRACEGRRVGEGGKTRLPVVAGGWVTFGSGL